MPGDGKELECPPSGELDLVILDDRIGEHLVGHLRQPALEVRRASELVVDFDLDELADADVAHALESEGTEGAFHRVALRVEHFALQPDVDRRPHATPRFLRRRGPGSDRSGVKASPVIVS